MKVWPEAYLHHHADAFVAGRIGAHGVTLEQYLHEPERYAHLALEPEPLLARQAAVRDALDAEAQLEALPRIHGAPLERMRHKAHHANRGKSDFRRRVSHDVEG
jgi:hypothetical protein